MSKSLQTMNAGEGVEKREPSYIVGGNANQYSHYGEQCGDSFKKCKQNCHMTQQSHFWAYTPRKPELKQTHVTQCSLQHCLQQPGHGSNLDAHRQTNVWRRKLWYIYTMEYYSAIKKNSFESVLMAWKKLEPIIQSEVSQKDKEHYSILTHIYGIQKDVNDNSICRTEKETQIYNTGIQSLWEKVRVVCFKRTASKHVHYLG